MQLDSMRVRNLVFALMFFSWGVLRIISAGSPVDRWTIAQLAPAVLHFLVAWLFITRTSARREGSPFDVAAALPSFMVGGFMVGMSPPPSEWPVTAQVVFVAGAAGTVFSLWTLGNSFAIFPAIRKPGSNGPYKFIRHPAYFFELSMLAGVCLAANQHLCWLLLPVACAMFVLRIITEERLCLQMPVYQQYMTATRFRLIPFVW